MYAYLEVNNDEFSELYVNHCGKQKCPPNYAYGPAIRPHYLIHFCLSGKGKYIVGKQTYEISKGDAFVIMPGETTYYQADEIDPWSYAFISFDGSKAMDICAMCGFSQTQRVIHCEMTDEVEACFEDLVGYDLKQNWQKIAVQSKLYLFLSYLSSGEKQNYETKESAYHNEYVNRAIEYIQNNFKKSVTVTDIAEHLSLHRSYLSVLFKKHVNLSPQQFLLEYRMTQAERMLNETTMLIKHISDSCGYANQLAFSKAFQQYHKISPREYRKKHQLQQNQRVIDPHEKK